MILAREDQVLDIGDDSSPPRAEIDQKSPGQIGLIRSDRKCFETFKILHQNLLMVNGDNKSKQIYKII